MTGVDTPDIQDPEEQQYQALKSALKRKIVAKLKQRQTPPPDGPTFLNRAGEAAGQAGAAARAGILSAAEAPMSLARTVPTAVGHQTEHAAGTIERLATDRGPAGLVGKGLSAIGLPEALRWISGGAKSGAQITAEGIASKAEGLVTGETPEQVETRYRELEARAVAQHGFAAELGFGVSRAAGSIAGFIYGGPGKIISAVDAPLYAAGQAAIGRSALGLAERAGLSTTRIAEAQKAGTLFKDLVAATAGSTKVRAATLSMMNRFGLKTATAAAGFGAAGAASTHDPKETEEDRVARAGTEAALSPIYLILGKLGQKIEGPVAQWLGGKIPWSANVAAAMGGAVEGMGFAQLDIETFKDGVKGAWMIAQGQTKEGGEKLESWLVKTLSSSIGFGFVKGMKPSAVPEFMRANPAVGRAPWSVFEASPGQQKARADVEAGKPLQAGLEAMDLSQRMSRLGWREVGSEGAWRDVRIPGFAGSLLVKNEGGPQVQVKGPLIELLGFEADHTYTGADATRAIKQVALATALNHLRGRSVLTGEPGLVEVDPLSAIYQGDGFRYAYRFGQVYRQAEGEAGAPWVVDAEKTARAAKRLEPQTEAGIALREPEIADAFADFANYADAYAEMHGKDPEREVGARALNVVADEIARASADDFAANPGLRDWLKTLKDPAHVGELFAKRGEDQFLDMMEVIAGTRSEVTRGKEAQAKEEAPDVPSPAAGDAERPSTEIAAQPMPMEGTSDFKVRRSQIREKLEEVGGAPIYTGDVSKKDVAGFYRLDTEFIRSRGAQDIATQAHEFGHHMHKQMTGDVHRSLGPKIDAELDVLGRELYGAKVPAQGHYRAEGVAEWFARDFLGDPKLRAQAPEFSRFAEQRLREMGKEKGIGELRQMFKDWSAQGAPARVRSSAAMHGDKDVPGFAGKLIEAAKASPMGYRKLLVDEFAPVHDMTRDIAKRLGKTYADLPAEKNPHHVFHALAMNAKGTAYHFIYRAAVDAQGNKVGPSLRERLREIDKKEINDFVTFAMAARALSKYFPNKMDPGFSEADAQFTWRKLQNPRFIRAVEAITQWGDLLIDYMVDAGGMTKAEAQEIRDKNPIWVPFYRDPEQIAGGFSSAPTRGTGKGVANKGTGIKKVKGADMQIGDIFGNLMEAATSIITRANQMRVARAFAEAIEMDPSAASSWHAVKLDNVVEAKIRQEKGDPVLSIKRGGETEWWEFKDEAAYRALLGLDKDVIGGALGAFLRLAHLPTRIARMGAVGLNPGFTLAQVAMDEIVAYVKSSDIIPFQRHAKGFALWFPDVLSRAFRGEGTEFMERIRALGLDQASNWLGDGLRAHRVRQAELFARTPGEKLKQVALHPLEAAERLLSVQNLLPRLAAFKDAYAAELKKGASAEEAMLRAMRDYKEATINFGKFGTLSRVFNMIEPFFNVRFQSPADMVRTLAGSTRGRAHAAQAWAKLTVGMTTATALLWYWQKDDKDIQDLPVDTRLKKWPIKVGSEILLIPKPQGWADLFANAPEAVLEVLYRKDPELVKKGMSKLVGELLPPLKDWPFGLIAMATPQAVQPLMEAATNRDFTFGTEIESKADQRLPETERAGKRTTELGKAIAKGLGVSPKDFEHVLRNYTGGAGLEMLRLVDHSLGGTEQKRERLSDTPFVGRFFARDDSRVVNEFYDLRRHLEEKHHAHTDTPAEKADYFLIRAASERITKLRAGAKAGAVSEDDLQRLQRQIAETAMKQIEARH